MGRGCAAQTYRRGVHPQAAVVRQRQDLFGAWVPCRPVEVQPRRPLQCPPRLAGSPAAAPTQGCRGRSRRELRRCRFTSLMAAGRVPVARRRGRNDAKCVSVPTGSAPTAKTPLDVLGIRPRGYSRGHVHRRRNHRPHPHHRRRGSAPSGAGRVAVRCAQVPRATITGRNIDGPRRLPPRARQRPNVRTRSGLRSLRVRVGASPIGALRASRPRRATDD